MTKCLRAPVDVDEPRSDGRPVWWGMAPSGVAALAVDAATADLATMSDDDVVEAIVQTDRLTSWVEARQARLTAELRRRRDRDAAATKGRYAAFVPDEVGMALNLSRGESAARVERARYLDEVLWDVLEAWEAGELDRGKVRIIVDATVVLSAQHAAAVAARVLPRAAQQSKGQLRKAVRRAVIAVDPEGAEARLQAARKTRRVAVHSAEEGMATLWAYLAATDARSCWESLTRLARGLGKDDPRLMDARRADLLVALLTGRVSYVDRTEQPGNIGREVVPAGATPPSGEGSVGEPGAAPAGPAEGAGPVDPVEEKDVAERAADPSTAGAATSPATAGVLHSTGAAGTPDLTDAETIGTPDSTATPDFAGAAGGIAPAGTRPAGTSDSAHAIGTLQSARAAGSPPGHRGPDRPPQTCADAARPPDRHGSSADPDHPTREWINPISPGKPLITVVIPHSTLLGVGDEPGELPGYGPIPAGLAREAAADGVWRRLVTDPLSGTLLDRGRTTYHPPQGLADHVRARDLHCRGPRCPRPATSCELDHHVAYPEGPTSAANLVALCKHHHDLKGGATHGRNGWRVVLDPDGGLTWTAPTGRTWTSHPHDYRPDAIDLEHGLDPPGSTGSPNGRSQGRKSAVSDHRVPTGTAEGVGVDLDALLGSDARAVTGHPDDAPPF